MAKKRSRRTCLDVSIPADVGDRFVRELNQLVDEMASGGDFKSTYLREEIFSKFVDPKVVSARVRADAAIEKWLAVEQRNARTNHRLIVAQLYPEPVRFGAWLQDDESHDFGWTTFDRLIMDVRSLVAQVLGPLRYWSVIQNSVPTNGASTRVRRSPSAALLKLRGVQHVSQSALPHYRAAMKYTRLDDRPVEIRESSGLFTVPKKSDIDRVAAKEPECNMLIQRSVGEYIAERLKDFGIDLSDQTVNQNLAQQAYARKLATIDLSSASDSISRELVKLLLPYEWFSLLDDLRVKSTSIRGKEHQLQMFSSMGNGFTFELESLIFYAITRVTCKLSGVRGRISVYGDDIIAPSRIVPRLRRLFHFFGFTMNPKKTHFRGKFRESCGRHYWGGFDVTPFYVKRAVRDIPDLINHLNHLLEWDGRGWGFFLDERALRFWERWRGLVPKFLWGGISPSDPTALVTGDLPRKRLVPLTRATTRPSLCAMDLWLLTRDRQRSVGSWNENSGNADLLIDPQVPYGLTAEPVVSCGERTTWVPGIAYS